MSICYYYYYHKCLYRTANSKYVICTNSAFPLGPVTTMNITKEAVYARGCVCYTLGCWGGDKIRYNFVNTHKKLKAMLLMQEKGIR